MMLMDFWPLQRFKHSTLQRLLFEKWPFFLLSIVFAIITLIAQQPALPSPHAGFFLRAENVVVNYYGYIEKLFWPHNLSFLYLRPKQFRFVYSFKRRLFCFSFPRSPLSPGGVVRRLPSAGCGF